MIYSIIATILSFIIFIGRPLAAFGKVEKALWFFQHFEIKRVIFVAISMVLGTSSLLLNYQNPTVIFLFAVSVVFNALVFLMDFKLIFPEINQVEKGSANNLKIKPEEKIIGVVVNNTAFAYPLDVLIPRHIINDTIENNSVLISYCALCRSALVFDASISGKALYFSVAGVWRRNMIMVDDYSQSIWQQATGECIYGKFKGEKLHLLSGENSTWHSWRSKHPQSFYAFSFQEARRGFTSRKMMLKGLEFATNKITPPGKTKLIGLPPREVVFGIAYNNIQRAYPLNVIVDKNEFEDDFGDKVLILNFDKTGEFLYAKEPVSEVAVKVEKHWWLGWKEFHPNTEIYGT